LRGPFPKGEERGGGEREKKKEKGRGKEKEGDILVRKIEGKGDTRKV